MIAAVSTAVWVCLVAWGMNFLWRYAYTPGQVAAPPPNWLSATPLKIAKRPLLLMFAHPYCPCSRASIGELAIVMAHANEQLDSYVYFYLPANQSSDWARTELWRNAESIPGVHAIEDRAGDFAKLAGVFTSGQTLLYGLDGQLVFNGGITQARGHSGDNYGRRRIISFLQGEVSDRNTSPVFGCSLRGL